MSTTASAIVTATASSLGATKSKNATVRAYAKGLDSEKAFTQQADINDSHQNQLNALRGSVNALAASVNSSVVTEAGVTLNGVPVLY